jgi:dephospho-CoA kinase
LQNIGWSVHEEKGQRWLGKKVVDLVTGKKYAVVDGLRFLEDHALMLESYGPAFRHFHIRTPEAEREKRVKNRELDNIELESATIHPVEKEISQLEKVVDHVISNGGTIENLYEQFDKLLKN